MAAPNDYYQAGSRAHDAAGAGGGGGGGGEQRRLLPSHHHSSQVLTYTQTLAVQATISSHAYTQTLSPQDDNGNNTNSSTLQDLLILGGRFKLAWFATLLLGVVAVLVLTLSSSSSSSSSSSPTTTTDPSLATTAFSSSPTTTTYTPAALADEVTALPGLPSTTVSSSFRQFSGYLDISPGKHTFYWYVEPTIEDSNDVPLTLWTNGGPGCSGLFGFLAENGPFRPTKGGESLIFNPKSWNTVSHMLFIEIPVGVGFSYADAEDKAKDYKIGDGQTARDNYLLVQHFLARFPHLRSKDFYIASESYGGHYVPTLAQEILVANAQIREEAEEKESEVMDSIINLRGILIGNPYTDPVENMVGMMEALYGRDLIPESLYERWVDTCESNKGNPSNTTTSKRVDDLFYSKQCMALQRQMWDEIGDGIDPYALDWPVCKDDEKKKGRNQRHALLQHLLPQFLGEEGFGKASWSEGGAFGGGDDGGKKGLPFQPCEDDYLGAYLNRADVKEALHANPLIKWKDCTNRVDYSMKSQNHYMEPIYRFLLAEDRKLRVLLYSGDDDSVCGPRGTELWLRTMGWKIEEPWHPYEVDGEVAGFLRRYDNGLIFATVHGAGHEVPAFAPEAALHLFEAFIDDDREKL